MHMSWGPEESRRVMEVVLECMKPGVPIAHTWEKVVEVYNGRSKKPVIQKQVINHYNTCRGRWVAWNTLSQMTGIALTDDGLPMEIEFQSDRIQQFLQKHKVAGPYVLKHKLHDMDIWNHVFAGRTATGSKSYSPASAKGEINFQKRKADGKDHNGNSEGSGDSEDSQHTPRKYVLSEKSAESRSPPPKSCSSKRQKRSSISIAKAKASDDLNKALTIMKMADEQESYERKLYLAVKNMEQVKLRGRDFQTRAIFYLTKENLGKMFVEFETDDEKWDWLKVLDK